MEEAEELPYAKGQNCGVINQVETLSGSFRGARFLC